MKHKFLATTLIFCLAGVGLIGYIMFTTLPKSNKQDTIATAYRNINETTWFSDGKDNAPHKAYIFTNINCIHCQSLIQILKPMIASGDFQVRWILVAYRNISINQSTTILNQSDNAEKIAALYKDHHAYMKNDNIHRIQPTLSKNAPKAHQQVTSNTEYMQNHTFNSTPTILFMQPDNQIKAYRGNITQQQLILMKKHIGSKW